MGNTPVPVISATGLYLPDFPTILGYFQGVFQGIYGPDIYIAEDSQDGQLIGLLALALSDANNAAAAAYNSFSPSTALGAGLSSLVKINGLARFVPGYSTCNVLLVGAVNIKIANGGVTDQNGNLWNLPALVTIPPAGQITVTATCAVLGAIASPPGSLNTIATPVPGWQTVNNLSAGALGQPVETDAALRSRQAISTELPSRTIMQGIVGAILAVPGVTSCLPYENDTSIIDANGLPANSIAFVVAGGSSTAIATAIANKKVPGGGTYGTTIVTLADAQGISHNYAYFVQAQVPVTVNLTVKPLTGFTVDIESNIQTAVAAWINAQGNQNILVNRVAMPAQLFGGLGSLTYELASIAIARGGGTPVTADVTFAFNEVGYCEADYVKIISQVAA